MNVAHFKQLDWDFREQNSRKFLHNLCWYPSRFIPMIPAQIITALSQPDDVVLDPFCGSGTVLIEALRQRRRSICCDINPLGCFIAKTKAKIYSGEYFDLSVLKLLLGELKSVIKENKAPMLFDVELQLLNQSSFIPNKLEISPWYHQNTLKELTALFNYIEQIDDELAKDILQLIFISILMTSSGHKGGRPYTYYADNVRPKVPIEKRAFRLFHQRLKRFISEFEERSPIEQLKVDWRVINGDARNLSKQVAEPVDLIITSPPYVGVTDYNMGFRLAHLWYDWNHELKKLKENEIGARWKRKRKDSASRYLMDMEVCFANMVKCLKKGKHLCIIIGESKKHLEKMNAHLIIFLESTQGVNLIHSSSRVISQKFFIHPSGGVQTEEILIFKKA
jgi:methylase of polypeptide subunit release factors